jgi:hypothetical protein
MLIVFSRDTAGQERYKVCYFDRLALIPFTDSPSTFTQSLVR